MKKSLFAGMIVIILCLFALSAGAADDTSAVIYDISPFMLESNTQKLLNGFDETNEGWDAELQTSTVTLSENTDAFPYKPLTGEGCLIVRTADSRSGQKNYISKTFETPLDLSQYNSLIISVNCSAVDKGKYIANAELYTDEEIFSVSEEIRSGCWNGITLNISKLENRSAINRIRISVSYESSDVPSSFFEYYVDSISASSKQSLYNSIKFSAEDYRITGGSGTFSDGVLNISASGDVLQLDSSGFSYTNIGGANCIKIVFTHEGICSKVRLYVQSSDGMFAEESSAEVGSEAGTKTVYLPVSSKKIKEISIEFDGVKPENIQIISIEPSSSYIGTNTGIGNIDTCAINTNTEEIIIKGSISGEKYDRYDQKEIYLFSNDLCDTIAADSLNASASIAKSIITSEDFIFRIKYSSYDDPRGFLYKKYTIAIKSENGFEIVDGSNCITNPESFTQKVVNNTTKGSGKGIYGESVTFMQEMGVSDTAIWVDIGKFFLQESSTGSKFECGGNLFYYNAEYFTSLDTMIKNYTVKNINVTLIFVISDTGNETMNRLLIHKDADLTSQYCAYNTSDRSGLMYLRAIFEFFAQRYCPNNNVTRFVFGDSVAASITNYNMGEKLLSEFVTSYANGLRICYNAVKSYSPYVEVYTYLDDSWDRGFPFDLYTRYDNRAFIDSLNACVSDMGNIDWGIAQNPYPYMVDDYFSYGDTELQSSVTADRVSFRNINVISTYFTRQKLLYNNSERDYIIIEKTFFSSLDEETVTADYVYNCYKALNTAVSAYITDRSCNYNDAMKYIDTSLSLTASSFVPDILGLATWESVIEGFSEDNIVKKIITSGKIEHSKPGVKGSVLISDFSKGSDGWKKYGFTERLIGDSSLSGRNGLLSLYLGNVPNGETRGIVKEFDKPQDMSHTPILHFGVNIASLPANINTVEITVIVTSEMNVYEFTGSVKKAVWTEIYCDLSRFSGISKIDSIKILFHANENFYDSPQALISSPEGISVEYDSEQLEKILNPVDEEEKLLENVKKYAYPVLIFTAVLSISVFTWRRFAKHKK